MNAVRMTLTARQLLIITDGSAESMAHQTLSYIPGNMLLGAFAQVWMNLHPGVRPDDDPRFRALFLDGGVLWGHAYPMAGGKPTVPIPLSFFKRKNHDGLPTEGDTDSGKKEISPICNVARLDDEETARDLFEPQSQQGGEAVKTKKLPEGFMEPETYCRPDQRQAWNIHVALGTGRCALDGQLFGYSALAPGSRFQNTIYCRDATAEDALREVLEAGRMIRVGHARSAGYGLVEQTWTMSPDSVEESPVRGDFCVFLHSDYIPRFSWQSPVDSLCKEFEALCPGVRLVKVFGRHAEIHGFNSQWRRPRTSRTALVKGSVLRFRTTAHALPRFIRLGADQHEGYGRLECDPAFLRNKMLVPGSVLSGPDKSTPPQGMEMTPLLTLLRQRALERQALDQAMEWLNSEGWGKFLGGMRSSPTQNQRGNLRRMLTESPESDWAALFQAMLEKSPGRQWKAARSRSPFTKRLEHLSEMMPQALQRKTFLESFGPDTLSLPGPEPSVNERETYESMAHRLFLLELLRAWEKVERTGTDGKEERAHANA